MGRIELSAHRHAHLGRPLKTRLRTSSATKSSLEGDRGTNDRMRRSTDGISKMMKDTHTHPSTSSHFEARARQRRRSLARHPGRCLSGSWYMRYPVDSCRCDRFVAPRSSLQGPRRFVQLRYDKIAHLARPSDEIQASRLRPPLGRGNARLPVRHAF